MGLQFPLAKQYVIYALKTLTLGFNYKALEIALEVHKISIQSLC
jgi:hypothetical protein